MGSSDRREAEGLGQSLRRQGQEGAGSEEAALDDRPGQTASGAPTRMASGRRQRITAAPSAWPGAGQRPNGVATAPSRQGRRSRRGRRRSGRRSARPGADRGPAPVPTCTMRPRRIRAMRSAKPSASSGSWVTRSVGGAAGAAAPQGVGPDPVAGAPVEVRERLVEEQDARPRRQGPGQGDALALAARERAGIALGPAREADLLQPRLREARRLRGGRRCRPKRTFSATVRCGNRA